MNLLNYKLKSVLRVSVASLVVNVRQEIRARQYAHQLAGMCRGCTVVVNDAQVTKSQVPEQSKRFT